MHQNKARGACEACHKRKIKCHLPAQGSNCQACQTSGRHCIFGPRNLGGRPRKLQISMPAVDSNIESNFSSQQRPLDLDLFNLFSQQIPHSTGSKKSSETLNWSSAPVEAPILYADLPNTHSDGHLLMCPTTPPNVASFTPSPDLAAPLPAWGQTPPVEPNDVGFGTFVAEGHQEGTTEQEFPELSPGPANLQYALPLHDPLDTSEHRQSMFANLLRQCVRLQGLTEEIIKDTSESAGMSTSKHLTHSILGTISSSCSLIHEYSKEISKGTAAEQSHKLGNNAPDNYNGIRSF